MSHFLTCCGASYLCWWCYYAEMAISLIVANLHIVGSADVAACCADQITQIYCPLSMKQSLAIPSWDYIASAKRIVSFNIIQFNSITPYLDCVLC